MRSLGQEVRSAAVGLLALVVGVVVAQLVAHDGWDVGTWAVVLGIWVALEVLWLTAAHLRRQRSAAPPPER